VPLPTSFPDRHKWMNRFIDNRFFGSQGLTEGLFTPVWGWVSTQTALPVILDQSTVGTAQLLLAGMPQAGRILPLALWVFTCQGIQNQPERTLKLQEYGQITIGTHGEFILQTCNWRSLWHQRPFSFQYFSLYLALNFGYMRGLGRMERGAKKAGRRPPRLFIPGKVLKIFSGKPDRFSSRMFLWFNEV